MHVLTPHLLNFFLVGCEVSIDLRFRLISFLQILTKLIKIEASKSLKLWFDLVERPFSLLLLMFFMLTNFIELKLHEVFIIVSHNLGFFDFALAILDDFPFIDYALLFTNPWQNKLVDLL